MNVSQKCHMTIVKIFIPCPKISTPTPQMSTKQFTDTESTTIALSQRNRNIFWFSIVSAVVFCILSGVFLGLWINARQHNHLHVAGGKEASIKQGNVNGLLSKAIVNASQFGDKNAASFEEEKDNKSQKKEDDKNIKFLLAPVAGKIQKILLENTIKTPANNSQTNQSAKVILPKTKPIIILEAMKMEMTFGLSNDFDVVFVVGGDCDCDGADALLVDGLKVGDIVEQGQRLMKYKEII